MDTEFDKELEKDLEASGWLDNEPVISQNPPNDKDKTQNIDELFSEIVAQAEASYISSKEAAARAEKEHEHDKKPDASSSAEPEIQVSKRENKRLSDLADKIKNAEVLKPEVIKDMFFGSRDAVPPEFYDDDEEDDDQPVLFTKRRPYTADVKKDKLIFEAEYMLTPDQAAEGYMLFFNEFVRKKNVKMSLMLGALTVLLLICSLIVPNSYIFYPFIFLSAAIIVIKWLGSMSARKDALASAERVKNDSYRLSFYNSRIIIKASELAGDTLYSYPPVMIRFEDIDLKVIDYDTIYVLVFRKDYVYTIPKDSFTPDMNRIFSAHLTNILGDDYVEFFTRRYDRFRLRRLEEEEKKQKEKQEQESPEPENEKENQEKE